MADIWAQLARYRQVKVLPDGLRILLRPLGKDDTNQLATLFERASAEDLERFRSDPTDRHVVSGWVENFTDTRYKVDTFDLTLGFSKILEVWGDPRTYGFTITYTF